MAANLFTARPYKNQCKSVQNDAGCRINIEQRNKGRMSYFSIHALDLLCEWTNLAFVSCLIPKYIGSLWNGYPVIFHDRCRCSRVYSTMTRLPLRLLMSLRNVHVDRGWVDDTLGWVFLPASKPEGSEPFLFTLPSHPGCEMSNNINSIHVQRDLW